MSTAMTWLPHELRLIRRSRVSAVALLLLLVLSSLAVWWGLHEVARQQRAIVALEPIHAQDVAAVAARYPAAADAGNAAYYTYYRTWDAPSDIAFLALGLRDIAPYVLRIRALGLQAQLYENEAFNPELALPGRFDFAFVLIYLAPLFVVVLLHDVVSGERQSGRLRLLAAMPSPVSRLWWRRVILRIGLVLASVALPMAVGLIVSGAAFDVTGILLWVVISYLMFWVGLALLVTTCRWGSLVNALALMACWTLLTLVLPTFANVALKRIFPVSQGVELMLAQRQNVHGAWEVPREETMSRFFHSHPEWRNTSPLPPGFHWKWYFAFHQVGDESVAGEVHAYRAGLMQRQKWTDRLGWLLPGVGVQTVLHRVASTDLQAHLTYQDRIAEFHREIRRFYYQYLFNDRAFGASDFAKGPVFRPGETPTAISISEVGLMMPAWLIFALGAWRFNKSDPFDSAIIRAVAG